TVTDIEPPVVNCPANIAVNTAPGVCTSNVTFVVTNSDNCTVTNLVSVPASGSAFPVGVTTVTSTATDASGNTASCTFTVTVTDIEPPVVSTITATETQGGSPVNVKNCANTTVQGTVNISVLASDICGLSGSPAITLVNGTNTQTATFVNESPAGTF